MKKQNKKFIFPIENDEFRNAGIEMCKRKWKRTKETRNKNFEKIYKELKKITHKES